MTDSPAPEASPARPPAAGAQAGTVKVGVAISPDAGALGEFLSDASAFDAAGADALWVDRDQVLDLDSLVLAAALAAVTYRARLVVTIPPTGARPGVSRAVDTLARLCRGRLTLLVATEPTDVTPDTTPPGVDVLRSVAGASPVFETVGDHLERWVAAGVPEGREAWRAARAEAAASGAAGIVVPADPRLLDLLRNPDDPGGRSDLNLAQG